MSFVSPLIQGRITPVVDSVYDFKDALRAYDRIKTGRARGKVVVKIDQGVITQD